MLRSLAIIALATACNASQATTPAPVNFVCNRLALSGGKQECKPEYTDAGELKAHTALVKTDSGWVSCGLNDRSLSVGCGPLFAQPAHEQPKQVEPAKAEAPKK